MSINAGDNSHIALEIQLRRKIEGHRNISVKCDRLKALTIVTDKQTMVIAKFDSLMDNLAQDIQNDGSLHDATIQLNPQSMKKVDQLAYVIMLWSIEQKKVWQLQGLLQEHIDFRKDEPFVEPNAIVHASKSKRKKRPHKKRQQRFNTVCRYFRDGTCKNGEWCRFRHIKYKEKLCFFFEENGSCNHGEHCTFIHRSEEIKK